MKKQVSIIILVLAILMVVSGCATKQTKENQTPVNNPTQNQVATSSDVVASSSDAIDNSDWIEYKSEVLGFGFKFPESYKLCLGDYCRSYTDGYTDPEFDKFYDENKYLISRITILQRYPRDTSNEVTIWQYLNKLDETAVEFGKMMKELNEKENDYTANSEKEYTISGVGVYSFDVDKGYNTNKYSVESVDYKNKKIEAIKKGDTRSEGHFVSKKHRLTFFDRGDIFYMIVYPLDYPIEQKIVDSMLENLGQN